MISPQDIETWIGQGLPCEVLQAAGDGQHFEALVVSAEFRGKSRVQQHQAVYRVLGERMRAEIHALSLRTYSPEEWQAAQGHA
jgi:acid stress-induced BolA-like protein IbaG/YrbA